MNDLGRRVVGAVPRVTRTAVVPSRVSGALSMRSPLTVVRGPRGFGKTTALLHWLDLREDDVATIYLALDRSAQHVSRFWPTLAHALTEGGLEGASPGSQDKEDPRDTVLRSLQHHGDPLRLVIDNYHHAGHLDGRTEVDESLLKAVRTSPRLELIALTRGLRHLETAGALSVDLCAVRPADLAMSAEDAVALARLYGLELGEDEAAHLVLELGGWPAAVRTSIVSASVGGRVARVDAASVDGYIEALLGEIVSQSLREFMLRTAIPEEFSAGMAEAIVPGGHALRELRNMRLGGLLQERETSAGLRYSYAPAIRDALRRFVREQAPETEREVHLRLIPLAAQDGPLEVLHHAVRAQEWDAALRIIEEEWDTLVTRHAEELTAVAASFPSDLREADPRLRFVHRHVPRMAPPAGASATAWEPPEAQFATAAVRQRRTQLQGVTDDVQVLLQSGIAAVFAGENAAATYAFERVRDHGLLQGDRASRLLGIGGMLSAKAIHGEVEQAVRLLEDPELADALVDGEDDDVGELLRTGGRIMHALVAVDGMRPEVHEVLRAMLEPVRRDDLWALAVNARACYEVTFGDPGDQARAAGRLRSALRHVRPGSIAESTLVTNLAETLVALGQLEVAEQVVHRLTDTFVSAATRAYLLHAQGRDREAVAVADDGLRDPRMTERSRLLSQLVLAGSLQRLGRVGAARQRFELAVQHAFETGQRRAFSQISGQMFATLADGDPALLALRPGAAHESAVAPRVPVAQTTAILSARELEVLGALRDSAGPAGVAESLGMSVNTAKTHLRHVYRKLGATNREEAIMLGRGLLAELA